MLAKGFAALVGLTLVISIFGGSVETVSAANSKQGDRKNQCSEDLGQTYIHAGRYKDAIRVFSCVIEAQPTEVGGYRGRIEAELLLGLYSDALRDYTRVTAFVIPADPDAVATILDHYGSRLQTNPADITALMGASFARWYDFDYPQATHLLNDLLALAPNHLYGNLFRGSSLLLKGTNTSVGIADLERAIGLAPLSPDVRFIVADAYTYGLGDPQRAFEEASRALEWGLDTPRVHAILASSYLAFGDPLSTADHLQRHIELVTTELVPTSQLAAGASLALDLVPGRTFEIPVAAVAGQPISILTSSPSHEIFDSIMVLLAPDGTPVVGSDDFNDYLAGFEGWTPAETGIYLLWVTSFEAVSTGELVVSLD